MNKGVLYYLGKFLHFLQNKFPSQYSKFAGTGLKKVVFNSLVKNYTAFNQYRVTEVKTSKKSKNTIEPIITKE